ncbi:MAG: hypothetical protein HOO95_08435 [Gallionella sp.]|nr:hypothetical protein [Gallionella sp.]
MPHLVVSISGHGFGHVAQTAPILNALYDRIPKLRITICSSAPISHLRSRIHVPFTHLPSEGDIGMVMSSALDVEVEASRVAYQKYHTDWDKRVANEAQLLRALKADFVFSNVGYLALAGAQLAHIPNVALCSLNWADIYRHYCGEDEITTQIQSCYANAMAFLRATPGMQMLDLPNLIPVAPIAAVGKRQRDEINRILNLPQHDKLVLVSMGGIASRLPIERWPRISGVHWLVSQSWHIDHPDALALETLQMDFKDILASCDALICKPGYGSFVEATYSGVPVIFVNRHDWPESPALVEWLRMHGVSHEVSRDKLNEGKFEEILADLWSQNRPKRIVSHSEVQVMDWLVSAIAV